MIDLKINSDDKEIIVTEHFMTFSDQPTELKFSLNEEAFILKLIFIDDTTKKDSNVHFNVDGDKLIAKFINFNHTLGMGNLNPMEIGTNQGKKMFMNVWITKPSEEIARKLVNITIYKEVD